jgi:hypothetical protein
MSGNVPGWTPGAPIKDDTPPCARCGHRAESHLNTGCCSVRGRWRRCRCSCYTASDWTVPPAAGPGSPPDDSLRASRPARREPAPGRQEDEQPPPGHPPGESRKRRILGKAADVGRGSRRTWQGWVTEVPDRAGRAARVTVITGVRAL